MERYESMGSQLPLAVDSEMSEESEGELKVDHVRILVSIPPKYSAAQVVGYVKGKSASWVARSMGRNRDFLGQNVWDGDIVFQRLD
jgi:REP element-mobilizing transposase RayT